MRRAVIFAILALLCGLVGSVSLTGELGSQVTSVDGLIVGAHTGSIGTSGHRTKTYYVDILRLDTVDEETVSNAPLYDAYAASGATDVTLDILSVGSGVDRISNIHYQGSTYAGTTKAEGIGVSIAFLVLAAIFLALAAWRFFAVRKRAAAGVSP